MRRVPDPASLAISIVSHGQAELVGSLLRDIQAHCSAYDLTVIVTLNIDEPLPFSGADFSFRLDIVRNPRPKGYGANHNAALQRATADYFCVMNPDIRLPRDPFSSLLASVAKSMMGVVAPRVVNEDGHIEDSSRRLPTPLAIAGKAIFRSKSLDYGQGADEFHPDWVAGMFMLFPSPAFKAVGGFDERYFLYYEDVDLCCRLRLAGYRVTVNPAAAVIHHAHRQSHRDWRYLRWHLASMLRFFCSRVFFATLRGKRPATQ